MNQGKSDVVKREMERLNTDFFINQGTKMDGLGQIWSRWPLYLLCGQEALINLWKFTLTLLIQSLSCRGCFNPMDLRTESLCILPRISSQSPQRCPSNRHTVGTSWPQGPQSSWAGWRCWPPQLLLSLSSPWRRGLQHLPQGTGVTPLAVPRLVTIQPHCLSLCSGPGSFQNQALQLYKVLRWFWNL